MKFLDTKANVQLTDGDFQTKKSKPTVNDCVATLGFMVFQVYNMNQLISTENHLYIPLHLNKGGKCIYLDLLYKCKFKHSDFILQTRCYVEI